MEEIITAMAAKLTEVRGVSGVMLGGSRARGKSGRIPTGISGCTTGASSTSTR